ncbi:MAG: SRPBCC family protein, partial [Myxococcota bacterium]
MPVYAYVLIAVGAVVFLMLLRIFAVKIEAPASASSEIPTDGKAQRLDGTRYMEYRVGLRIQAPPERIWAILTDAGSFTEWNSTLVSLSGIIALGQKIALVAKVAPERTFKIRVSAFEAPRRMVWEDGNRIFRGVRTFLLEAEGDATVVTMAEGDLLPEGDDSAEAHEGGVPLGKGACVGENRPNPLGRR